MCAQESLLKKHEQCLRDKVFFTDIKWPHYNLLLDDLKYLNKMLPKQSTVFSYERNALYGGYSPFLPFFSCHKGYAFDYSPPDRGAYNKIEDRRFICHENPSIPHDGLMSDLVIVPNVLHHISAQKLFLDSAFHSTRKYLYIFEPLIREIHQAPYDYIRYTPDGLCGILEKMGGNIVRRKETGGIFTSLAYLYEQSMQYLPENQRDDVGMMKGYVDRAKEMDKKYPVNLAREHTSCPTAYSILVQK